MSSMLLLGGRVIVCTVRMAVNTEFDEEKTDLWSEDMAAFLECGSMDSGSAAKAAGQMSFAVTTTPDKVGRAFVRPLYRQQFDPPADSSMHALDCACGQSIPRDELHGLSPVVVHIATAD